MMSRWKIRIRTRTRNKSWIVKKPSIAGRLRALSYLPLGLFSPLFFFPPQNPAQRPPKKKKPPLTPPPPAARRLRAS